MAVRYDAVDQADDGSSSHAESPGHSPSPPDSASSFSPMPTPMPVSHATSTAAMASPVSPASLASPPASSPLPSVALADQTFTPLSIDSSDFFPPDNMGGKKTPAALEADRLLSTSRSMEQLRRNGNLSRSSSSKSTAAAAPASAGPTIVSAMVESFEALQAATSTATLGYELLRTKSAGQRPAGLVSPPSTLSPSPSLSYSPPSPAPPGNALVEVRDAALTADSGLGAADKTTPIAAQDENTTVPLTAAAAAPNPDPSAPISNAAPAHDAAGLPPASAPASPPSAAVVASTTLIRPTPSASQPQQRRSRAVSNPIRPPIIRTSSNASLSLSHPAPDPNKLSQAGNFLGNIAALEATAERLSMTSSIEDAIREEHNELKRSESRRSSILRARAASTSDNGSVYGQSQLSVASRQNSILGINNAARSGGYSPGGFIMSPHHSMSAASGRLRSGSKASSIGMPSHIPENTDMAGALADLEHAQEFRFLPRHGPGKASTRSVASKMSLAQIAELEHPTALTQEALDEADRAAAAGETPHVDDTIRSTAHQFIEAEFEFANGADEAMLGYGSHGEPTPRLQLHQPDQYQPYRPHNGGDHRPTTSGSGATYEQAQAAFGDFDGVHCDPDAGDLALLPEPELREPPARARPLAPRPTTYFDPATGQHMMFYPAPVPAMLNLPPKLSKKPKAPARDTRHSQAVKTSHESRIWLPDPTEGFRRSNDDAPFMGELLGESSASTDPAFQPSGMELERPNYLAHARHPSEASTIHPPLEQRDLRRPQRLTDADNRTSRPIAVDGMPPQLRASAFFDLPPETPKIEVKDGSAMNTLDSLLDASAAAPVSAFTDHVFAGKLGAEVYGPEKKKKKVKKSSTAPALAPTPAPEEKAKRRTLVKRTSSSNLLEPGAEDKPKRNKLVKRKSSGNLLDPNEEKKRASRFSLFGPKHVDAESDDDAGDRPRSARRSLDDDARSRGSASPNQLAPDADEETETESEEEAPVYQGPPTTLLAELQLRKQQNKLRTRPVHHVYTEGMRSTLLELDAVAEVERKARHGKRVTLAWEDPAAVPRAEEEDDDEVPLGMLFAAKAAAPGANRSTMDISTLMSEVHRPLGLMERREIEENEPLSRRRDRLQGRVGELPSSLTVLQNRMSHMPPTPGMGMGMRLGLPQAAGSRADSMLGSRPGSAAGKPGDGSEPEVEGETLAARKARLAAENPLPRARPVSSAFSAELLREFGPDEEEAQKNKDNLPAHSRSASRDVDASANPDADADADANGAGPVPEEEETLGQRRRRLQREREAREREMAFSSLTRAATPLGMNPAPNNNPGVANTIRAVRPSAPQMGMADVLGAHPTAGQPILQMTMDPRERERVRREAEAARYQREAEVKMAALRAQMPSSLTAPAVGGRSGGYLGGRFNDGGGGAGAEGLVGGNMNHGMMGQQQLQQQRASTLLGAQGMGMGMGMGMGGYGGSTPNLGVYPNGVAASMSVSALPMQAAGYPMQMPMPMVMGVPMGGGGQGHMDMVERWRQGVMP